MQKLIYPENVLDLIFGVKSEHAWTELNRNRQEAITLLEGAFFSFLQAELEKEDRNEEPIETQIAEGKFLTMRWDFNALEWITFYKLYFKEQKSIEEIASDLNMQPAAVRMQLSRARNKIREIYKQREQ